MSKYVVVRRTQGGIRSVNLGSGTIHLSREIEAWRAMDHVRSIRQLETMIQRVNQGDVELTNNTGRVDRSV